MSAPRLTSSAIDRRRFLEYVWWGAGSAMAMALIPGGALKAAPRFASNPFTLGVASGDPTSSGIVLWTRLAPDPADPTSLGPGEDPGAAGASPATTRCDTSWRRARRRRRRTSPTRCTPRSSGLRSGADYFFQFDSGGEESAVGHFRTAPRRDDWADQLTFAVATCQDVPSGYYTAYRDMVATISTSCSTSATTRTSTAIDAWNRAEPVAAPFNEEWSTCARTGSATRCTSSTPTSRRPTPPSPSSWCGTTTRCRTTTRAWRPSGDRRHRSSPPAAPPPTRRSTSTCRSGCARATDRGRAADLPAFELRPPRRVHDVRRPPVPHRQPVWRR